jgi:osmotically-inducible protein OsmY
MGRFLAAVACGALLTLALGCNRSDESRAKQDARDLGHKIKQAVTSGGPAQPGTTQSAEQKLRQGSEDLRIAGQKAGVKLDRAALIAKVKAKLVTGIGISTATSIDVDAHGQVVTLKGTVPSEDQKRQAEESVRQLDGVAKVVNDLTVAP